MIDFSNCKIDDTRYYGGRSRRKIAVIYENQIYMLKFPFRLRKHPQKSYSNDRFSEYISCHIAHFIGLKVQEVLLGNYNDKIVVACKDFEGYEFKFNDFLSCKNSVLESKTSGNDTRLSEILMSIENQHCVDKKELKVFFWDMFILDAYVGNTNRHNENWGFLGNEKEFKIAPIFACGGSLYPHILEEDYEQILNNEEKLNDLIHLSSAIKNDNGTYMDYYTFLRTTDNEDCLKSLQKIYSRIDKEKIDDIIENCPYITNNHKIFLKTILHQRQNKILLKALQENENLHVKSDISKIKG